MTVTLKFKPEVEAGLQAQARASGMSVEEYVLSLVERTVLPGVKNQLSPEERAAAFEAWSAGHRPAPPCLIMRSAGKPCMKVVSTDACPR
jgi:hypothetical protein